MTRTAVPTLIAAALLALVAASAAAHADEAGGGDEDGDGTPRHAVSLGLVWSGPTTSFNDEFGSLELEDTVAPALTYEYRITPRLGASARLGFATHDVAFVATGSGDPLRDVGDLDVQPLALGLNFYLDDTDKLDFYVTLPVVGYAFFGSFDVAFEVEDDGDVIERRSTRDPDDEFLYGAGIGLDMPFGGKWYFTSSIRFIVISSEIEIEGESIDLEMDPLELHAGVAYRF